MDTSTSVWGFSTRPTTTTQFTMASSDATLLDALTVSSTTVGDTVALTPQGPLVADPHCPSVCPPHFEWCTRDIAHAGAHRCPDKHDWWKHPHGEHTDPSIAVIC